MRTAAPGPYTAPHLATTLTTTESLRHHRVPISNYRLSRDHEALRLVIKGNGGPRRLRIGVPPGYNAILYQMRLKVRRLSALKRRVILHAKLFRSGTQHLYRCLWIERNVFHHRLAFFATDLEDAVF
jgi:hypothetical protein